MALSKPDDPALRFSSIAMIVGANTLSERTALRRALNRLVTLGTLGRRAGKRMYGGPREIVWFIAAPHPVPVAGDQGSRPGDDQP
jgi:hypothetical protein